MKKRYYIFLAILVCLFFPPAVRAAEKINKFEVLLKINPDASLEVSEKIYYDFGRESRHGIYRDLPYKYNNKQGSFKLRLTDFHVSDEAGRPYSFKVSNSAGNKRIKIGDPDKLVSGEKIYRIDYKVKRALGFFPSHDELYWNVTGNNWQVKIEQVLARAVLPARVRLNNLQTSCFFGFVSSQASCQNILFNSENNQADTVAFRQNNLEAGEGLTIVFGWPKAIVSPPSRLSQLKETLKDNIIILFPLAILLAMLYVWFSRGRDPGGRGTIIAQYDVPDGLSPAEVGTIIDEQADALDISANIISLAERGFLKITQLEERGIFMNKNDYRLDKLKSEIEIKEKFEKQLFNSLFKERVETVKLSELKNNFYKDLKIIKDSVYQTTVAKGYFFKNPQKIRNFYFIAGILIVFFGLFGVAAWGVIGAISIIASGAIVIIFSFFMPARTTLGVSTKEHILGLKQYLAVAEKDRLDFHNAPEKNPEVFEKFLPYAIVLRVEKEWAKQFAGIYDREPAWFSGPDRTGFNALILADSLRSFTTKTNATLAVSAAAGGSGFSGGGFSGGGFGGGGGGSW